MRLNEKIKWRFCQLLKFHFPFLWSKHLYKTTLGKVTNFRNPKDLNEKIQWLMFFTDTSRWTSLADKYAVRQYVKDKVGEKYLIPLLGKWDCADDIDFESLPTKFVIKPNNGSYDTVICSDKNDIDLEKVRERMSYSLANKFGYENAEPHYLNIKPCIIAEELLETDDAGGLIDYKIWCFNGIPHSLLLCVNRDKNTHHADLLVYDLNWTKRPEILTPKFRNSNECPKPNNLDEMLIVASKLSDGFPQVRVDLYNIQGKIYFGEMTFSSNFGMMPYYTNEALLDMGRHIRMPQRSAKEKITTFAKRWFPYV